MQLCIEKRVGLEKRGEILTARAQRSLWNRAFGGNSVADSPSVETDLGALLGERISPLEAGANIFESFISSNSTDSVQIFLVGGPGAGKSHTAKQLVSHLTEVSVSDDALAQRVHIYEGPGKGVHVVNDATMTGKSGARTLVQDINLALESDRNLVACVNRGILAEEVAVQDEGLAQEIINKVDTECVGLQTEEGLLLKERALSIFVSYYKNRSVLTISVYLDALSLFEDQPIIDLGGILNQFGLSVSLAPRKSSQPGRSMIEKLISKLAEENTAGKGLSPLESNITSLADPEVLGNFIDLLRSAEVLGGSVLNYRAIWAICARAIYGALPENGAFEDRNSSIFALQERAEQSRGFADYQNLASYRFHQAIFGADNGESVATEEQKGQIAIRPLHLIDPVRGMGVGQEIESGQEAKQPEHWSRPVLDSISSSSFSLESSPLSGLKDLLSPDDAFWRYLTEFDEKLDTAFVEHATRVGPDESMSDEIKWYSQYLLRAYAVANGIPGFAEEIRILIELSSSSPDLPDIDGIDKKFMSMLRPKRDPSKGDSGSLLTLFASRVAPIIGSQADPILAVEMSDLTLSTDKRGRDLFLLLEERGSPVGEVLIDFALVREVRAWISQMPGITEQSLFVTPRVERARASKLAPKYRDKHRNTIVVAYDELQMPFTIRKSTQ